MKILLDAHVLRAVGNPDRLPESERDRIEDPGTTLVLSAASLGDRDQVLPRPPALPRRSDRAPPRPPRERLRGAGGRMLLAQAIVEGLTLVTADRALAAYPGPVRLI